MKIKVIKSYKSLESFESAPLTEFAVITGKNGSGKSQLVELIQNSHLSREYRNYLIIEPKPQTIQVEGIVNQNMGPMSVSNWQATFKTAANNVVMLPVAGKELVQRALVENLDFSKLGKHQFLNSIDTSEQTEYEALLKTLVEAKQPGINTGSRSNLEGSAWGHFSSIVPHLETIRSVAQFRKKSIAELKESDFLLAPIQEHLVNDTNLFVATVDKLFYAYAKRRHANDYQNYQKTMNDQDNDAVSDAEFVKKFPPPWIKINEILTGLEVNFEFKGVDQIDFDPNAPVSFRLVKKSRKTPIRFNELSSGEKVILGIVTKLFTSEYYAENLKYPDLLVLDEPDANLHPEMTKILIDLLYGTFVKKLGMKVLMTTHSPSTVALCPDECLFELQNDPVCVLRPVEKDEALKLLTGFIPTLSIDYKNHKQVFVESPTDTAYYQAIFDKLYQDKARGGFPFKLYFISSAAGKSNCSSVIQITQAIRATGNTTSFGLIDWDQSNISRDFVFVHGEGKRHNIESYLFDPIFIVVLFLTMDGANNVYRDLSFDENYNQYCIGEESNKRLQEIVDWFFEKFVEKKQTYKDKITSRVSIEYFNGKSVEIPKFYINYKGHDLFGLLKSAFPALNRYHKESELQAAMTKEICKCYPFIPSDTVEVIRNIVHFDYEAV